MSSEMTKRTGRISLAEAFRDFAQQVSPFAAATTGGGETGHGSISARFARVYAGGATSDPQTRNGSNRLPRRS